MKKTVARALCGILTIQLALSNGGMMVRAGEVSDQPAADEIHNPEDEPQKDTAAEDEDQIADTADGDMGTSDDNSKNPIEAVEETREENGGDETTENKDAASTLNVKIKPPFESERKQEFRVYLKDTDKSAVVPINPEEKDYQTTAFPELDAGTYVLRMESAGYASYEQKVEITKGYNYSVSVALDDSGSQGMGYMPYGDWNGDGVVEKSDVQAVVDALEAGSNDLLYDIDGNGKVDLIDLEKAVRMLYVDDASYTVRERKIVSTVIPGKIQGTVAENTKQEGSVDELLTGTGFVSLSPAKESAVISSENPVELSFGTAKGEDPVEMGGLVLQTPSENRISTGTVEITYVENGEEQTGHVVIGQTRTRSAGNVIGTAKVADNGQLTIKLNGQIAVKKVTITITSMTKKDASLAEITRVEFVNDMENYIPAPTLDIPEVTAVTAGNKTISASWKKVTNITGYQIGITLDGYTEYINTKNTSIEVANFRNKSLENKKTYTISVQAVNGDWKSGYHTTYTATPKYDSIPDAPDSLTLSGDYRIIRASWKAPKDDAADSYTLYYQKKGESDFQKIAGITATNYTLYDLEDEMEYVIYVTAVNEYGEGPASLQASVKTKANKPVKFSQYRIINGATGEGELTDHIVSVTRRAGTRMESSALDEGNDTGALGVADNHFASYYQINDWDDAVSYHTGNEGWGLTVQLDQTFKMDRFAIAAPDDSTYYSGAAVYYWEGGVKKKAQGMSFQRKTDSNGRAYYEINLTDPIETDQVQFGLQVSYYGTHRIQVAELRLYEYDSLADDIRALYTNDLYIALRESVKEEDFDRLQERIDTKINGDYHPQRSVLQAELDAARKLYEEQGELNDIQNISTDISASYDGELKLSGLNAWQPLGVSAKAGDEVVIYVGTDNGTRGNKSKLQLVATQQHSESDKLSRTFQLNVGRNVITIPELINTDVEKGGALYIQYTGNNADEAYAVRVTGGRKFPVLDLYKVTDESEQAERIRTYVDELSKYCAQLEESHEEDHGKKILFFSWDSYDDQTCINNTTDIVMDHMMISVPATQILSGLGSGSQTEKLTNTVEAMDAMMELFYQHKGLTDRFEEGTDPAVISKNHLPSQHLNIRYMKMFSGAFMYAAGNHIGIEWGSVKDLILNQKPVIDENGRLTKGSYFGWGIAHEIGHQINQSAYSVAEITNNYFAVLAQADGTNDSVRFSYGDVYDKVTSGAAGYSSNVFTQLGMYWQLHLAYDGDYAQKTYDTYADILDHRLFARVDTYVRNTEAFNALGYEVSLALSGDKDQDLMRLVSAAAKKNLTEFFTRWGFTPNEDTSRFMSQFEEETRAIYYINDHARTADLEGQAVSFAGQNVVKNVDLSVEDSDVTLHMNVEEAYAGQILGYEIVRVSTNKGNVEKEVVGFTTSDTFTDSVNLGSRAVSYEVYAIDLQTARAAAAVTDTVKVLSDGSYDKSQFTVTTNMASELDHKEDASEQDPCAPEEKPAVNMVLDKNKTEEYTGKADQDPYVLIDLKQTLEVSALRYDAGENAMTEYKIEVSRDGNEYMTAAEGTFEIKDGKDTVYFTNGSDPWVVTYDVRYLKVTAVGQAGQDIGIKELDILGPSGDNIEFTDEEGKLTIGRLSSDYVYDKNLGQKIPEGSIVFAGSYKGNPAYNVVVLYDQNGSIVGGTNDAGELIAQQIILAPNPGNALLGEVSEGSWIYWIEPDQQFDQPLQVKAELYRVDNGLTNEGERLTSDTVYVAVPDQLEDIEIAE